MVDADTIVANGVENANTGPTKEVVRSERKTATKARQAATPSQRQSPEDISDSPRTGDGSRLPLARQPSKDVSDIAPISMPALDLEGLTENSPLAEIRDYIERHGLDVATNVGGRERRTKAQMFKDLKDAVSKASGSSSSTPLSPLNCNEKVVLSLKDRQRVGFRTHLDACVKSGQGLGREHRAAEPAQSQRLGRRDTHECATKRLCDRRAVFEGLAHLLGVSTVELCKCMSRGRAAIEDEIDMHGTEEDKECLAYVLNKGGVLAGESPKMFPNGVRDKGRKPLRFEDFCEMDEAKRVGLEQEEVLALRLYTTAAFKSLNHKLRLRDEAAYLSGDDRLPALRHQKAQGEQQGRRRKP